MLVYWIVALPIFIFVVGFSIQNHAEVVLSLWPFNIQMQVALPLVLLGVFVIGFFAGGFIAWVRNLSKRHHLRESSKEFKKLEGEVMYLKEQLAACRAHINELPKISTQQDL